MIKRACNRRKALKLMALGSLSLSIPSWSFSNTASIMKRAIPSTGEKIGVVGLGTWQTFDVGNSTSEREPLKEVLKVLIDQGGSLIDSSPMYGSSEKVVGDLTAELNLRDKIFYATKVWTSGKTQGERQMQSSIDKMRANPMDLMQIHNLQDWKTHIKTLYDWKEKGLIKYIGITHYVNGAHSELERIIKSEQIDFVQMNYSIVDRNAEKSLIPIAQEKGVAVITNRPYAGGSLFQKTRGVKLPDWADEFGCNSWGQFFLKYLIGNEAVTCVIPGTSKPYHMTDNMGAGLGRIPDATQRNKMVEFLGTL